MCCGKFCSKSRERVPWDKAPDPKPSSKTTQVVLNFPTEQLEDIKAAMLQLIVQEVPHRMPDNYDPKVLLDLIAFYLAYKIVSQKVVL